ncbi:unnamed protein product [Caenorhabditis sp. 36 PRJEB53466]|nr:unnamed protein product [Caenorhabditis sp. 36 PRJEB53466]
MKQLLLLLCLAVAPHLSIEAGNDEPAWLTRLNKNRAEYAKNESFANAAKLELDERLRACIETLKGWKRCSNGLRERVVFNWNSSDVLLENPVFVEFAYIEYNCSEGMSIAVAFVDSNKNVLTGKPGSACPKGRHNEGGLCASDKHSTVGLHGTSTETSRSVGTRRGMEHAFEDYEEGDDPRKMSSTGSKMTLFSIALLFLYV